MSVCVCVCVCLFVCGVSPLCVSNVCLVLGSWEKKRSDLKTRKSVFLLRFLPHSFVFLSLGVEN